MPNVKRTICWITPDYFFNVDAKIVPRLATDYSINWLLIATPDSQRTQSCLLSGKVTPTEYQLKYRQRDPRIILEYISLLSSIRKKGYDLLYTSFHGLPFFFPVLASMINLDKVIYGVHNVSTPKGATHERSMRLYQRYAFSVMKRFHVFSQYQLRTISGLLPKKHLYYAPLAPDDYGPSLVRPPSDKIRFLFFGYIRRYKRLDLLIKSFQTLYNSGVRNIELVIAGRCDDWERYETLIDGQSSITTKIGIVSNEDIPDLISSCHYVVMPYQDGAQSAVLTLAYHYNKPVITSDIESFKDTVVDKSTGFFFDSLSHESLTAVMKDRVLKHDASYDSLTQNVRDYVRSEYSTDEILGRYRLFIDDALSDEHSRTSSSPADVITR